MSTIKSSREIDAVFRSGRRVSHPLAIALISQTPPERDRDGRVAFIAGKRLGGAVVRNRNKRVLRAACRAAGGPWSGWDILLIAREGTADAGSDSVSRAIVSLLKRAGIDQ